MSIRCHYIFLQTHNEYAIIQIESDSPLPDSPDRKRSKANERERTVEGEIHMKDFLKAIRVFLRRIQFTVTLKTPSLISRLLSC